jgi:uncharacterized membrane protein
MFDSFSSRHYLSPKKGNELMDILHQVLTVIMLLISGAGAVVVIWGVVEAVKAFFVLKIRIEEVKAVSVSESIRQRLGAHLLLGLEIFIAADIISSAVSPTWEKVGILAATVGIRTILSYFLRMEVREKSP